MIESFERRGPQEIKPTLIGMDILVHIAKL
jgi:hypothetical protein